MSRFCKFIAPIALAVLALGIIRTRVEPVLRVDEDRMTRPDVRGVLPLVQVSPPGQHGSQAGRHRPPA